MSTQNKEPKLTATEQKLLSQVQANAKPRSPWVKYLTNTIFGFWY